MVQLAMFADVMVRGCVIFLLCSWRAWAGATGFCGTRCGPRASGRWASLPTRRDSTRHSGCLGMPGWIARCGGIVDGRLGLLAAVCWVAAVVLGGSRAPAAHSK